MQLALLTKLAAIISKSSSIPKFISCISFSVKSGRFIFTPGTFTPFFLVAIRKYSVILGWTLFGIIWATAIVGITLTAVNLNKFKKLGMILYLAMGWAILIAFKGIWETLPKRGIFLLIAGGVIYTIGAIIYGVGKNHKYMHSVFHFLVLLASTLFFLAIFMYVI